MKGSLAACMLAAAEAKRRGLRGDVILTAVADEEFASIGTEAIAATLSRRRGDRDRADRAAGRRRAPRLRASRGRDARDARRTARARTSASTRSRRWARPRRDRGARRAPAREPDPSACRQRQRPCVPDRGRAGVLELPGSLSAPGRAPDDPRRDAPSSPSGSSARSSTRAGEGDPDFSAEVRAPISREPFEVAEDAEIVRARATSRDARPRRRPGTVGVPFWADSALLASRRHPDGRLRPDRRGRCTPRSSGSTSRRSSAASRSTRVSPPSSVRRREGAAVR